jgi:hypothetical protein
MEQKIITTNQSWWNNTIINNFSKPQRIFDDNIAKQLKDWLDITKEVTINCVFNDSEAYIFSTKIFDFLKKNWFSLKENRIMSCMFQPPIVWQQLDKENNSIKIGTNN